MSFEPMTITTSVLREVLVDLVHLQHKVVRHPSASASSTFMWPGRRPCHRMDGKAHLLALRPQTPRQL
jgi:hypothetical protein